MNKYSGVMKKSCVFFGHRDGFYDNFWEKLSAIFTRLIQEEGVTQFYTGARGNFDGICTDILQDLRKKFPQIKITLVYSYIPKEENLGIGDRYDDSVYLLEKRVLPKFAIWETNKALIDKCDFVVLAVWKGSGGAYRAAQYAKGKGKTTLNIYE